MRHTPLAINRISVEASTDMIIHSTCCHLIQCEKSHITCFFFSCCFVVTEQEIHDNRSRKFGRLPKTTILGLIAFFYLFKTFGHPNSIQGSGAIRGLFFDMSSYLISGLAKFHPVTSPCIMNSLQNLQETRTAITCTRWEICSGIKRSCIRKKKNRHGPSTTACHGLGCCHVDLINIRSFFAIHLD